MEVTNFINNDLKQFSNHDNVRSIPSIVDGFKESQRKVIFGARKYCNSAEKVSRLAGNIAIATNYKHGEVSMQDTIVGLAQNFPGSNNINLLEPLGQFGTILSNESSSPRYISTKKSSWFDKIINNDDDIILDYKDDEGTTIEPYYFYPTLPLWLVNGRVGIGTGHSSKIASRDPKNVIKVINSILSNKDIDTKLLFPYFGAWKGDVNKVVDAISSYEFSGKYEIVNTTTIRITELPIGFQHTKYKEHLISLLEKGIIKDYDSTSTEESFDFVITCARELTKKPHAVIMKTFKLISKFSDNITLWDKNNALRRFDTIEDALQEWVEIKLESVERRRLEKIRLLSNEVQDIKLTIDFIIAWNDVSNEQNILKLEEDKIVEILAKKSDLDKEIILEKMKLPIRSLTLTKVDELSDKIILLERKVTELKKTSNIELYKTDLKAIK